MSTIRRLVGITERRWLALPTLLILSLVISGGISQLLGSQPTRLGTTEVGPTEVGTTEVGTTRVGTTVTVGVATTSQIGDIVRNIGGEMVELKVLMGEGVDPHLYWPTRSDIKHLNQADVVFYNGLHLEAYLVEMLEQMEQYKPVIALSDVLGKHELLEDSANARHDPHIWMDVRLWMAATQEITSQLAQLDPIHERFYQANAVSYLSRLEELDRYAEQVTSDIPEGSRVLVTAHDAFSYMGRRYGLEVIGIQGISTSSEASVRRLEEIVTLLVTRGISSVFVETSVSDRTLQALIEGAAAQGHQVRLGARLYSDAMGPAGSYQGTYIGMIDHNVTSIASALGGTPPAGGLRGRSYVH